MRESSRTNAAWWWGGGAVCLLTALLAGCGVSQGESSLTEKAGDQKGVAPGGGAKAAPEKSRVLVRLGDFERGDISSRLAVAADLEAVHEADVYPELPGVIQEIVVREGSRVAAGDPVIRLIDDQYRLAHENRKILYEQAKTGAEQARLAVRESENQVELKKLLEAQAQREFERLHELSAGGDGIISPEEVESKRYARDQRQAERKAADLQVEHSKLEAATADQAEKLAEVNLQTAKLDLDRTVIRSPIDGYISLLDLKRGETVGTARAAFSVVDVEALEAKLHVPQRELARLKPDQEVIIHCEVWPDREFRGRLAMINPVIDAATGTVRVRVGVHDESGLLKPGMFITGEIIVDTHRDALLVPKRALSYENQEPVVFLVKDGVARHCVLEPGFSTREHLEVLSLRGFDGKAVDPASGSLVLVGHNNLEEGTPVEIETEPEASPKESQ